MMKAITTRIGEEDGRVISLRTQAGLNTATDAVCVSCALWHGRAIYPTLSVGRTTIQGGD